MDLKRAADLYKNPNPLWENMLFTRLMNKPGIQKIFIEGEINFRRKKTNEDLKGGYLSMGDNNTSIILADTQILEKCIRLLNASKDVEKCKGRSN